MPIAHMYAPRGNGKLLRLYVNSEMTEIISEAYTFEREFLTAAMTLFENSLGGKVVVMGMTVKGNMSQSLFNYRRMRLFEELLKRLSADVPMVRGEPGVHLIFNRAKEGEDFSHLLTAVNLCEDTLDALSLYLPDEMKNKTILYLDPEGKWKDAEAEYTEFGVRINRELPLCEPMCLLFKDIDH